LHILHEDIINTFTNSERVFITHRQLQSQLQVKSDKCTMRSKDKGTAIPEFN